jgi:hypothetical protein
MKLTPVCYYNPNNDSNCWRCGKHIDYTHILINNEEQELSVGKCCVVRMRASGEIYSKLPRNGRYDWTLKDVRDIAKTTWYCQSLANAK